jgi:hypothetical protein
MQCDPSPDQTLTGPIFGDAIGLDLLFNHGAMPQIIVESFEYLSKPKVREMERDHLGSHSVVPQLDNGAHRRGGSGQDGFSPANCTVNVDSGFDHSRSLWHPIASAGL